MDATKSTTPADRPSFNLIGIALYIAAFVAIGVVFRIVSVLNGPNEALGSYLPTVIRYAGVAIAIGLAMYGFYKLQLWLGIKREAATGRTLVLPWMIGFLIFTVFTVGASLYLSFTD